MGGFFAAATACSRSTGNHNASATTSASNYEAHQVVNRAGLFIGRQSPSPVVEVTAELSAILARIEGKCGRSTPPKARRQVYHSAKHIGSLSFSLLRRASHTAKENCVPFYPVVLGRIRRSSPVEESIARSSEARENPIESHAQLQETAQRFPSASSHCQSSVVVVSRFLDSTSFCIRQVLHSSRLDSSSESFPTSRWSSDQFIAVIAL